VNNLMAPVEQAKYDLLWVLDSTISITPGTLGRMVDAFVGTPSGASFDADLESTPLISDETRGPPQRGDVGLVHHVPYAIVYQNTLGSLIEQAFLNTTHAKMYLAIVSANRRCHLMAERDGFGLVCHGEVQFVLESQHRVAHQSVTHATSATESAHGTGRFQPFPGRRQHDRAVSMA
jgi:hypothetical protein